MGGVKYVLVRQTELGPIYFRGANKNAPETKRISEAAQFPSERAAGRAALRCRAFYRPAPLPIENYDVRA